MSTLSLSLAMMSLAVVLTGCQLQPPLMAQREDFHSAEKKQLVKFNDGAFALVGKDTSFSKCREAENPAIILNEGKVVVVKQHDGEVCDIIAGPAWARLLGTTVLAEKRGPILRMICVEGRARVNWGNRLGEYRMLNTGEMLMVDESRQTLPDPVLVNLNQLLSREELLAPDLLGSEKLRLIELAAKEQAERLEAGRLEVRGSMLAATGSPESLLTGDSARIARAVDTRVNTLSSQTLGAVGGATGAVTGVVTTVLGGLLGLP